jgi:hypothetical protein
MRSHFTLSSAAVAACAVTGVTSLLTSNASAQFSAADYATNSTYSGGWLSGQNGGFGFTSWSFGGTTGTPVQQGINSSSPFNHIGTAWRLFNPFVNPTNSSGDLANAGRGFAPLGIGQTLETVIDNPTQRKFYRGYTIRLASGTDNTAVERFAAYTFEYFSYGNWFTGSAGTNTHTSLFDTDTAAGGAKLDFTLTGTNSYYFRLTPLNNPANYYSETGTLKNSGPIDYILFQFYNTQSDPNNATDFYISSITIVPEPSSLALIGLGSCGLLFLRRRKK